MATNAKKNTNDFILDLRTGQFSEIIKSKPGPSLLQSEVPDQK